MIQNCFPHLDAIARRVAIHGSRIAISFSDEARSAEE
jgi:hypothetical protein